MDAEPVKILLVDDRPANLVALESALADPGYQLVKAGSGAEALRFLLSDECALILLDVNMPELDGYETARLVRQNPRTRNIPIVFITAYGADERRVQAGYQSGAVDYLFKPVAPDLLRSKVAAFVELHRAHRQLMVQAEQLRQHERREHALALAQLELQSLRRQEAAQRRHRTLLEGITHAVVWVIDPVTLVCRFASPSAEALLGHPPRRLTGDADLWRCSLHREDRGRFLAAVAALAPGSDGATVQHRFVRADGSVAWFETALRLLPSEEAADRLELRGFSVEITEVVQARAALELLARASAELFSTLEGGEVVERAAAMGLGLADGCVVEVWRDGAVACRAAAHARADRRAALERLSAAGALSALCRAAGPEVMVDPAGRLEEADARELGPALETLAPAGLIHVPLMARAERLGTLLLFAAGARAPRARDLAVAEELGRRIAQAVENARLYAEAREAVQLRERFLSIASHELRTPLAALLLQVRVLDQAVGGGRIPVPESSKQELTRRIRTSVRQVERLGSLVNSLFDLARIRSGRLTLERGSCDLGAIAREVAERFEDQLARQGRDLLVDAAEPVVGLWDRGRLDQALTNLVANAVKHGGSGRVTIRIERRGPAARIAVRDAGPGIPEQDRARIFELFEQGERGNGTGGLGLGLYITRRIAQAHGGRIWVECAPEGGSIFQLELPVEREEVADTPEPITVSDVPHVDDTSAPITTSDVSHAADTPKPITPSDVSDVDEAPEQHRAEG